MPARLGSSMSDKQMAYAATHGRQVTFRLVQGEPITGYICGMDDFHWLVVHENDESLDYFTTLVHKGLAAAVTISPRSTLDTEPQSLRDLVAKVGGGFVMFCNKTYFGKTTDPATQEHAS